MSTQEQPPPPAEMRPEGVDWASPLLDSAWRRYAKGGSFITKEEAIHIWRQIYNLGNQSEGLYRLITLARLIDREATRGLRCSVCAGRDGNHDDC